MTAKPSLFPSVGRVLVYGVLLLAAAFFLLPLYAMLVTSFKDAEEIRTTSLLALPGGLNCRPGRPRGPVPAQAWTAMACGRSSGTPWPWPCLLY